MLRLTRDRSLAAFARRAASDRRGLAAVEFALLAPLLILLYFALAELSSAIIASRHSNHATSALGDLVSQCSNLNDSDLSNMFNASTDILAPLSPATLVQTVSSAAYVNGATKVQWSRTYNGASATAGQGLPPGQTMSIPANILNSNGDTVIVTETVYQYRFPFSPASSTIAGTGGPLTIDMVKGLTFDNLSYYKPRKSSQVNYTGATASGGDGSGTSCYAN